MSINRNRAKLNKALDSKEYTMIMKNVDLYCYVCARRAGNYEASCHPTNWEGFIRRCNRTWKHNRNTQWK